MALLLAALAVLLALVYLVGAALGLSVRRRAWLVAAASALLVVLPTAAFMAMGLATDRPYGQDGGVVQLPLALDRILSGASPYGADYSKTMLGRQARASSFWESFGENPILHHHAYLPGTHLVMAPFHLVARGLGVPFDPRVVTLLFYALTIVLAARLPDEGPLRMAAAGVAGLNPLVYWHQIFGANDLVFVAMLLGVVHLARAGRLTGAAALTGLACATKQLAWPFAPFLLLSLSGARRFTDLGRRETWSRMGRPLLAAGAIFLAIVLPVAALDWRAFWGDIVVYNVGLPGADNYPLGGTPGFGFANFLIYFGKVRSLRDYFPFGVFYLVLVPLGLLLLRRQLREGSPVAALCTGSAALVLSLYFSRVVHANYLIPVAVLLPAALLALRRPPDTAMVPLLLLLLGVEIAENGVFRETWAQAAAAGWPARLGGLAAALAPRAGPELTLDPLGLIFSAAAAGLAVAYLAGTVLGLPREARIGMIGVAVLATVVLPARVVGEVGERTGVVRAQDRWAVQVRADAARLAVARSPYEPPPEQAPLGREAFSMSFRLDPPAELVPDRPVVPPGTATLVTLLRPLGLRDPRPLLVAALVVLGIAAWRLAAGSCGPAAVSLVLMPPLALGSVLGSPVALCAAALAVSYLAVRRGRPATAGLLAGVAAAFDHRAALVAPFLLIDSHPSWRRAGTGFAIGYSMLVLPVAALDLEAFRTHFFALLLPEPGVGLANLFAYRGEWAGAAGLVAITVVAMATLLVLVRRKAVGALPAAAASALIAVFLSPAAGAEALGLPITLLGLGSILEEGAPAQASTSTLNPP